MISLNRTDDLVIREVRGVPLHKSAADAKDIDLLPTLISDALQDYQKRYGIAENKKVRIQYVSPKEYVESPDLGKDIILFKLIKRRRWNSSSTTDRRPKRPFTIAEVDDPNNSTNRVEISIEKRENLIELSVYSKHSQRANELALMVEDFISAYTWYLKDNGINNIYFESREEDTVTNLGNDEFYVRPLRYIVYTDKITQNIRKKLDTVFVKYDVGNRMISEQVNSIPEIIEHSVK